MIDFDYITKDLICVFVILSFFSIFCYKEFFKEKLNKINNSKIVKIIFIVLELFVCIFISILIFKNIKTLI